jgi:hypothetical protein
MQGDPNAHVLPTVISAFKLTPDSNPELAVPRALLRSRD